MKSPLNRSDADIDDFNQKMLETVGFPRTDLSSLPGPDADLLLTHWYMAQSEIESTRESLKEVLDIDLPVIYVDFYDCLSTQAIVTKRKYGGYWIGISTGTSLLIPSAFNTLFSHKHFLSDMGNSDLEKSDSPVITTGGVISSQEVQKTEEFAWDPTFKDFLSEDQRKRKQVQTAKRPLDPLRDFAYSICIANFYHFIALHELGHILRNHFKILTNNSGSGSNLYFAEKINPYEENSDVIKAQSIEIDADLWASFQMWAKWNFSGNMIRYGQLTKYSSFDVNDALFHARLWFISLIVTSWAFGSESDLKFYDDKNHPHPDVRYRYLFAALFNLLPPTFTEQKKEIYIEAAKYALSDVISARNLLIHSSLLTKGVLIPNFDDEYYNKEIGKRIGILDNYRSTLLSLIEQNTKDSKLQVNPLGLLRDIPGSSQFEDFSNKSKSWQKDLRNQAETLQRTHYVAIPLIIGEWIPKLNSDSKDKFFFVYRLIELNTLSEWEIIFPKESSYRNYSSHNLSTNFLTLLSLGQSSLLKPFDTNDFKQSHLNFAMAWCIFAIGVRNSSKQLSFPEEEGRDIKLIEISNEERVWYAAIVLSDFFELCNQEILSGNLNKEFKISGWNSRWTNINAKALSTSEQIINFYLSAPWWQFEPTEENVIALLTKITEYTKEGKSKNIQLFDNCPINLETNILSSLISSITYLRIAKNAISDVERRFLACSNLISRLSISTKVKFAMHSDNFTLVSKQETLSQRILKAANDLKKSSKKSQNLDRDWLSSWNGDLHNLEHVIFAKIQKEGISEDNILPVFIKSLGETLENLGSLYRDIKKEGLLNDFPFFSIIHQLSDSDSGFFKIPATETLDFLNKVKPNQVVEYLSEWVPKYDMITFSITSTSVNKNTINPLKTLTLSKATIKNMIFHDKDAAMGALDLHDE